MQVEITLNDGRVVPSNGKMVGSLLTTVWGTFKMVDGKWVAMTDAAVSAKVVG